MLAYPDNHKEEEEEEIEEESIASNDLNQNFLTKLYHLAISAQYIQRIPL